MNTMKGFYASISSASRLQGSYLEALSKITRMSSNQAKSLRSDQGWQDWSQPNQIMAIRQALAQYSMDRPDVSGLSLRRNKWISIS